MPIQTANTYSLDIFKGMEFRAQATVNAEELLVHYGRQRQRTERLEACLINPLTIFVLALQLEGEVVRQMTAFVVTPQQPKRIRVPNLQCPEVENALWSQIVRGSLDVARKFETHLNTEITPVDVVTQK
jgi:hypothetical protein